MSYVYEPGASFGVAPCKSGLEKYRSRKNRLLVAAAVIAGFAWAPAALAQSEPSAQHVPPAGQQAASQPAQSAQPADCTPPIDPYKNYACLDAYLGDDPFS